jgi:hypothetical protein
MLPMGNDFVVRVKSEIGNRVIVIVVSITITIRITLIVCNCNSVRFFKCVIVIVLAFCYYRLLLPLTFSLFFKSLDLKNIDVNRLLFIVYKVYHLPFTKIYHLSFQKFMVNLSFIFSKI